MRRKEFLLLAAAVVITGCTSDFDDRVTVAEPTIEELFSQPGVEESRITVKLDRETADAIAVTRTRSGELSTGILSLDDIFSRYEVTNIERIFPRDKYEERMRKAELDLWYTVSVAGEHENTALAAELSVAKGITYIEPVMIIEREQAKCHYLSKEELDEMAADRPVTRAAMPNDPYFSMQWMLVNDGSIYNLAEPGADINFAGAWSMCKGSPDVVVAVLDGGIDYTHPDLAANMWDDGEGNCGMNFSSSVNGTKRITPDPHGTHVAGTIGAVSNNGVGITGIAGGDGTPNSGVKLMSVQVFDTNGRGGSDLYARAIQYAANNGAVVCQNSWGFSYATVSNDNSFERDHAVLKAAIDYFINYAGTTADGSEQAPDSPMKGGVILFSAGNEGYANINNSTGQITFQSRLSYPAAYSPCISVAAISCSYEAAFYSTFNDRVDISAPGGGGWNYSTEYDMIYNKHYVGYNLSTLPTTLKNGDPDEENPGNPVDYVYTSGYGYMSGTSMACPHVSGVAALVVSYCGGPGFTAEYLTDILMSTTRNIDEYLNDRYIGKFGVGLVDATAALDMGRPVDPAPPYVIEGAYGDLFFNRLEARVEYDLNGWFNDVNHDIASFKVSSSNTEVVTAAVNGSTLTLRALTDGESMLTATATDSRGESASLTLKITVNSKAMDIDVYPNPCHDTVKILLIDPANQGTFSDGFVTIRNSAGAEVYSGSAALTSDKEKPFSLNVSALNNGVYTIVVEGRYGNSNVSATRTIIKK